MAFPNNLSRTKNWGTEVLTDTDLEGQFDLIINWLTDSLAASAGHNHTGVANYGPKLNLSDSLTLTGQTVGDLIYAGSSSAWSRLAAGTDGYVLKSSSSVPTWTANTTNVAVMFYVDGIISTGDSQSAKIRVPFAGTITRADAYVDTAPTDAAMLMQVQINGSDIWTAGQRLTVADAATSGNTTTFTSTAVAAGDYLQLDIDQVGSTVAGADLTVSITMTKTI